MKELGRLLVYCSGLEHFELRMSFSSLALAICFTDRQVSVGKAGPRLKLHALVTHNFAISRKNMGQASCQGLVFQILSHWLLNDRAS